jgi:hypothetical protein
VKYCLLLLLTPLVLLETGLQTAYFLRMQPEIITSCCGSLFSPGRPGVSGDLLALPHARMQLLFFGVMAVTLAAGAWFRWTGRGALLFGAACTGAFLVAAVSLVSFISPYIYELPTHHCPFCILQREYGFIGYPLYGTLMGAGIAGVSCGVLLPFRLNPSLHSAIPRLQRRLAECALLGYLVFTIIVVAQMTTTSFRLD